MCLVKKVEQIGIAPDLSFDQKDLRKTLWLIAIAMDNRPDDHANQFYSELENNLLYLRRRVLIWETDDKKSLIELIDLMLEIFQHDKEN